MGTFSLEVELFFSCESFPDIFPVVDVDVDKKSSFMICKEQLQKERKKINIVQFDFFFRDVKKKTKTKTKTMEKREEKMIRKDDRKIQKRK